VEKIYHLKSAGISVVIDTTANTPNVIYWGEELGEVADLLQTQLETTPHCDFDEPQLIGSWRENSRGFLGEPSLRGSRFGREWSHKFELTRTVEPAVNQVVFVSVDAAAELEVDLSLTLDEHGVLHIKQSVTNLGLTEFNLEALTSFMPLPDHVADIIDFHGRWMKERQLQRLPIRVGNWVREGREGRTGHDYTLIQLAGTAGASYEKGELWGMSLAWSGNNRHIVERTPIGRTSIGAGELLLPGEVVLQQGESHHSPEVVAVYSANGLNGVSERLHNMLRARSTHPTNVRPRPVTLNVWEAVYFDHHFEKLSALAETAAKIGVERFVLDDGWFGARRDDHAGLGDWVVAKDVWPEGLHPIIDKVRSLGLEFGLWFEGEMVNANSDLYRAHPDWILHSAERTPPTFRNQQVLDLAHPGAFDHVFGQVDAILNEYEIAYIKWDHNRVLTEASHFGQAAVRRQVQAIYRLFDALKAAHPGLEIESCASGGGRIDLGMIDHVDRFWTSDNNDALERQMIFRNTSIVIPPELLGTHIGPRKAHSSGRTHTDTFRSITALWGHAGLEWDLTEASEEELVFLKSWVDFYKQERNFLHSGKTVRVDQSDETALVHGVVSHDRSRGLFSAVQLKTSDYSRPFNIRLTDLDPYSTYLVRMIEPAGAAAVMQLKPPHWLSGVRVSGRALGSLGLRSPVLRPEQSMLIEAVRV
jgi:alpha-galactosidase